MYEKCETPVSMSDSKTRIILGVLLALNAQPTSSRADSSESRARDSYARSVTLSFVSPNPWKVPVWVEQPLTPEQSDALEAAIGELHTSPLLKRLDGMRDTALLISSSWTRSPGFWSPTLRAPDGMPAILIQRSTLTQSKRVQGVLIHEWAHALHGQTRPQESGWVRELVALTIESLNPVEPSSYWRASLDTPETSLTQELNPDHEPFSIQSEFLAIYGHWSQFKAYLYRLCGGETFLGQLIHAPAEVKPGIPAIEYALARGGSTHPVCASFSTVFRAFEIARLAPSPLRMDSYVGFTGWRAQPADYRPTLPPYSAGLYRATPCAAGDLAVPGGNCLMIREE